MRFWAGEYRLYEHFHHNAVESSNASGNRYQLDGRFIRLNAVVIRRIHRRETTHHPCPYSGLWHRVAGDRKRNATGFHAGHGSQIPAGGKSLDAVASSHPGHDPLLVFQP